MKCFNILFVISILIFFIESCSTSQKKYQNNKETNVSQYSTMDVTITDSIDCMVFWDYADSSEIFVFNNQEMDLCIKRLRNYQIDDNILLFNVHGICRNMLYVTIYNGLDDSVQTTGWIEQTDKLMVMPSDGKGNIILRSGYLDKDSIIVEFEDVDIKEPMSVVGYSSIGWIKVHFELNDVIYEGWIEPGMFCSNPYTTCN